MIIIGLNAYHGDSSACIIKDGRLIAAVEEERFRRVKHWAGFPSEAIKYCLSEARVSISDVDFIAINRNPKAHLLRKAFYALNGLSLKLIIDRLKNAGKVQSIKKIMASELNVDENSIRAKVFNVEHHIAHLASAFFVSPFKKSAVVSIDGFGDFVGAMWGIGEVKEIYVMDWVFFPH
jgi:carbamoyltransferase